MKFDEFVKTVEKTVEGLDYSYEGDTFVIEHGMIIQRHEVGGASGGNCWGDFAETYTNSRDAEPFIPLEAILRKTSPDISYLKFREIEGLIEEELTIDSEYYGNYKEPSGALRQFTTRPRAQ